MEQKDLLKEIISHCKEYGFVFPSSEIYDGLAATYDYGQLGAELKNNIKTYWWKSMTQLNSNIVGLDSAIFMHPTTWKASGHVDAFNDPLIDNKDSKNALEKVSIKHSLLPQTPTYCASRKNRLKCKSA
jgi:glycyl-tRNA synthetase